MNWLIRWNGQGAEEADRITDHIKKLRTLISDCTNRERELKLLTDNKTG